MKENTRPLLAPHYMQSFACIGSNCEDSCCIGWQVSIDRRTYKKYQLVKDKGLKHDLERCIGRNRSDTGEANYAKIRMSPGAACPFLSEDRLCRIQAGIGEDYLSDVCTTYPRIYNIVNDVMEKSATLSCPEAARLALLNPHPMEFDEIEEKTGLRYIVSKQLDIPQFARINQDQGYFWDLRMFTIQVLQNRNFTLNERLIIMGMFCQKLDQFVADNLLDQIPGLIATYIGMLSSSVIKEELDKIPIQAAIQMQMLKALTDERILGGVDSPRYMDYFVECLHGLQYGLEDSVEEIAARYQEAEKSYYRPFMDQHEYIMENYLVNYIFKSLFPFNDEQCIFDNYVLLVIHYALIKMHLIGIAGFKRKLSIETVISFIQCFVKVIEHSGKYLKHILQVLNKAGYTNMAYMAILIKN